MWQYSTSAPQFIPQSVVTLKDESRRTDEQLVRKRILRQHAHENIVNVAPAHVLFYLDRKSLIWVSACTSILPITIVRILVLVISKFGIQKNLFSSMPWAWAVESCCLYFMFLGTKKLAWKVVPVRNRHNFFSFWYSVQLRAQSFCGIPALLETFDIRCMARRILEGNEFPVTQPFFPPHYPRVSCLCHGPSVAPFLGKSTHRLGWLIISLKHFQTFIWPSKWSYKTGKRNAHFWTNCDIKGRVSVALFIPFFGTIYI